MNYRTLLAERDGPWLRVTLNRPEVRNAFNDALIEELTDCFDAISETPIRAVVLSGAGPVFCAGADIEWMHSSAEQPEESNRAGSLKMARMISSIDSCPVPVIAAVQKAAFGGGLGLIAACDIAVADEGARFSFSEVRLGIIPAVISSFALRKIGTSHARRYFLTGEAFGAQRAREIGLIHEVVASDELERTVDALLDEIIRAGPFAVREAKRLIRELPDLPNAEVLDHCAQTIARLRASDEGQEGLSAFLERRPATWTIDPHQGTDR